MSDNQTAENVVRKDFSSKLISTMFSYCVFFFNYIALFGMHKVFTISLLIFSFVIYTFNTSFSKS